MAIKMNGEPAFIYAYDIEYDRLNMLHGEVDYALCFAMLNPDQIVFVSADELTDRTISVSWGRNHSTTYNGGSEVSLTCPRCEALTKSPLAHAKWHVKIGDGGVRSKILRHDIPKHIQLPHRGR